MFSYQNTISIEDVVSKKVQKYSIVQYLFYVSNILLTTKYSKYLYRSKLFI